MALKNNELGEQCYNEAIARAENEKPAPFGKYVLPCAHYELAQYFMQPEVKDYASAKTYLQKAGSFKDFELENRVHSVMRGLQRKLKYLSDPNAKQTEQSLLKARAAADAEQQTKKETEIKNFFLAWNYSYFMIVVY